MILWDVYKVSEMFQHNENFNTIQLQCHGKAKCSIYKNHIKLIQEHY